MTDKENKPKMTSTAAKAAAPRATAPKRNAAKTKLASLDASHDQIASLAHRFWTERGGQHGHDTEDWLRAERQVLGKAS